MGNTRSQAETLGRSRVIPCTMRPEERERMYELCALIEKERDHHKFLQLINELNDLLERKEQTLTDNKKTAPAEGKAP